MGFQHKILIEHRTFQKYITKLYLYKNSKECKISLRIYSDTHPRSLIFRKMQSLDKNIYDSVYEELLGINYLELNKEIEKGSVFLDGDRFKIKINHHLLSIDADSILYEEKISEIFYRLYKTFDSGISYV